MADSKSRFVERLFAEHGRALQAFIYRRIRTKADAPDLAQEVYVRMLRVSDTDAIRNPEVYLYTVASNLVKEHAVLDRRQASSVDVEDVSVQQLLGQISPLDGNLDTARRAASLHEVLMQLTPKCRAAVVLHYRDEWSYQRLRTS
jgi:RNA polymerase sigma-70 factor (ECF subfamily)